MQLAAVWGFRVVRGVKLQQFGDLDFVRSSIRWRLEAWSRERLKIKASLIEAHVDVKTTDGYNLRMFCIAFTKRRPNQVKMTAYAQSSQRIDQTKGHRISPPSTSQTLAVAATRRWRHQGRIPVSLLFLLRGGAPLLLQSTTALFGGENCGYSCPFVTVGLKRSSREDGDDTRDALGEAVRLQGKPARFSLLSLASADLHRRKQRGSHRELGFPHLLAF
ncbi:hypothetical protein Droror1_Dr00017015 [Drosera rotundifolia]